MKQKFIYGQSGVQGFFGKTLLLEYWYQLIYWFIPGYKFDEIIFVSKTATLKPRVGNTALRSTFKIKAFLPSSIWVSPKSFWYGYILNAVGISNPGLEVLLKWGLWQKRKDEHFHISIQLEGSTWDAIEQEIRSIVVLLEKYLSPDEYSYDLQINESCPNTEHSISIDMEKVEETKKKLQLFELLLPNTRIWVKYNALISVDVLTMQQPFCEGFVISNTIPFGTPCGIDWNKWFKGGISPLPKRLGKPFEGGVSGAIVLPVVLEKMAEIEAKNNSLNIIAGGGIMKKRDIDALAQYQVVKKITYGSVALLRPWRVKSLIKYGNEVMNQKTNKKVA